MTIYIGHINQGNAQLERAKYKIQVEFMPRI